MANKQPLFEHKGGSLTNSSNEVELKIHEACCKNETQKVTHFLLRRRNDIDAEKLDEFGSLFVAINNNNFLIVDGLLGIGCNSNAKNSNNKPALFVALENGNMCIASSLINHGAKFGSILTSAIRKGLSEIVEKVLELRVDIDTVKDKMGYTPLYLAIDKNNLEIVKLLLKHNVNANRRDKFDRTPLLFAISKGNSQIVKELVSNGAEVDGKNSLGMTPFMKAWTDNQMDIAKILLDHGADVDFCWHDRSTTLHFEATYGNLENVRFLLKHNANINAVDNDKDTPLHLATQNDHAEVVKLLLINGGNDLNVRNEEGNTAFESAIAENHFKVSKIIAFHDNF